MVLGVDVSTSVSPSQWACLAAANVSWTISRAWHSSGAFDKNAVGNLVGAQAAGIAANDVYLFPCRGRPTDVQANSMLTALRGSSFGFVWIDVESNPSRECSWDQSLLI